MRQRAYHTKALKVLDMIDQATDKILQYESEYKEYPNRAWYPKWIESAQLAKQRLQKYYDLNFKK